MKSTEPVQSGRPSYVDPAILARARELLPLVRRELGLSAGQESERVVATAIERAREEAA